jgi:quercetin dioxygenase-like cupin family protein
MKTFYDEWLEAHDRCLDECMESMQVACDDEIPWVSTPQDVKSKLMISNKTGFATMGSNLLKSEIPVGWHTGKHRHGEESMHILEGEGFSIIAGQRFDWHKSSTLQIPYGAEHQHFNTGGALVLYLSAMAFDLERFVRIARLEQIETCGPNDPALLTAIPPEQSQHYDDGSRAVLHIEDAPTNENFLEGDVKNNLEANRNQHDFVHFLVVPNNGFKAGSVAITHQWTEPPYHQSGRHKHLEAVVYAVEGEGYTEMQGKRVQWKAGDALFVPPAMWEHQHMNDNPNPITQLRIAFGIRQWFTDLWPEGFTSQRIYDEKGNPIVAGRIERKRERSH